MEISSKHYQGKVCRKCNQNLRYKSDQSCVTCRKRREQENSTAIAIQKQKYYQENRDSILTQKREYYDANREQRKAYNQEYFQENRDRLNSCSREYYQENRDSILTQKRQYHKKNSAILVVKARHKRARRELATTDGHTLQQLKERFALFGNQCVYCLSSDRLTVDHFFPLLSGGLDVIGNTVPACLSCNSSKGAKDPLQWMREQGLSEHHIETLSKLILAVNSHTVKAKTG